MDDWGSILGRGREFFSSPPAPDWVWGPPSFLPSGYRWLFPGGKAAKREAGHSPPTSAEIKNKWSYTLTPYVFMAWYLVKYRDFTFTFTLYESELELG
jgi:hypothetical protein